MTLPLVVLAAGLSTRYGRLKQLDPLGPSGEAIMDYNVYDALRAGFDRFAFIVRPEIEEPVRRHLGEVVGDAAPMDFVLQSLDELPEGFRAPPDRRKPWGTAQAVLCAAPLLEGAFGVCNADDLYGPGASELLRNHLEHEPPLSDAALVGYTLEETLTGTGGVARGVCVLRRRGRLERVTEVREIRRADGWITGRDTNGEVVELSGSEIVSMNLWGFTPAVVDLLRRQFTRFLEHWGADTQSEFFLSTAVNGQVQIGASAVAVLNAPDPWLGVTHAGDREHAREALAARVAEGVYPRRLAEGFSSLI